MRSCPAALLLLLLVLGSAEASVLYVRSDPDVCPRWGRACGAAMYDNLQAAIDAAADGDTIRIAPGLHGAQPQPFREQLCGNCVEHRTEVCASTGFRVLGKRLTLLGAGAEKTIFESPVINEVHLFRRARGRILELPTYINQEFLTQYRADGILVSTPTGSTSSKRYSAWALPSGRVSLQASRPAAKIRRVLCRACSPPQ